MRRNGAATVIPWVLLLGVGGFLVYGFFVRQRQIAASMAALTPAQRAAATKLWADAQAAKIAAGGR
jgi:hypothetical protein